MSPTVAQLDEAYGDVEGYPKDGNKSEKEAFADDHDGGAAGEEAETSEASAEKDAGGGKYHVLFDSIHYEDEDGHFQEHVTAEHGETVDLPAKAAKRLVDLGAVTTDAKKAAEYREARRTAQEGASVGSQVVA